MCVSVYSSLIDRVWLPILLVIILSKQNGIMHVPVCACGSGHVSYAYLFRPESARLFFTTKLKVPSGYPELYKFAYRSPFNIICQQRACNP